MPLNNKPQWYKDLYASVHPDPLARAKVPIIEIGKPNDANYQILVESDVVARFVAENWKSQGEQLVPDNKFAEAKMNLFIGQFMEKLGTTIFSFPATKKPNAANKAFLKILYGLQTVEASLKMHGETESGPYFFGKQYSLAETLTAPFVLRMNILFKHHRGVDLLDCCEQIGALKTKRWMEAIQQRQSSKDSLPAENSLLAIPPYQQPFFEYSVPHDVQANAIAKVTKDIVSAKLEEEAAFAKTLKDGSKLAGYKDGTLSKL